MSYQIKSLGYRTDFIFNRLDGAVEDRGDYIVAKTASNPNYFWGNLLLYKEVPKAGDFKEWIKSLRREFNDPRIYHMTFAWDSPDGFEGDISEFIENGFELEKRIVLKTSSVVKPPKFNESVDVKVVDLDVVMNKVVDIQLSCANTEYLSLETLKEFYIKSIKQFAKIAKEGHGKWFGAFLDGDLVGSLGLFTDGDVARFQIVSTHKDFQRRGICSSLVYKSALYAFENMGAKTLVMVADEDYHAAKIYESVGFKPNQYQIGLCWWDKEKHK
ncbi:GNAT family N-acetyltransferase [Halobacteriovorax sp. HFRX-2_2]|uniref:GNAT family N-acetyltransferase n=1 Tax=unclassified Halobacteriovorax TaxID=2639665 RepID=UPI0037194A73